MSTATARAPRARRRSSSPSPGGRRFLPVPSPAAAPAASEPILRGAARLLEGDAPIASMGADDADGNIVRL